MDRSYSQLGQIIVEARNRLGLNQIDLAHGLDISQQTVSRWEKGTHRPRQHQIEGLAEILKLLPEQLSVAAKYVVSAEPVVTFVKPFPLSSLGEDEFEIFAEYYLSMLHPEAKVNKVGSKGHAQEGTDVEVRFPDGTTHSYQCKRHNNFGPDKVRKAVEAHKWPATKKFIFLSRPASPQSRKEIKKNPDWEIIDAQDISTAIRLRLSVEDQCRLVDSFFKGRRLELLGVSEIGPWQTLEEFYAPFGKRESAFNHDWRVVGNEGTLAALVSALLANEKALVILSGPGGSGKSRLLKETLATIQAQQPALIVRLLSPTDEANQKSLSDLGTRPKILVVDDAHDRQDLKILFQYVADAKNKAKLLLSIRPYGIDYIRGQAATFSLSADRLGAISVKSLTLAQSEELAKQVLVEFGGSIELAAQIAKLTFDCPLATVLGAQVAARDKVGLALAGNEASFRDTLYGKFQDVIAGNFGKRSDSAAINKVLSILALLQPFYHDDKTLISALREVESLNEAVANSAIRFLIEAGILFKRGGRYRLSPDLLADFIIEKSCIGYGGISTGYVEAVFNAAGSLYAENILTNIAKLDWRLSNTDTSNSKLLNGVWQLLKPNSEYQDRHINAVKNIAYYQPARALDFVRTHSSDKRFITQLPKILKNAAYNLSSIEAAAELLWEIGKRDNRPTNQHPDHGIRILAELCAVELDKPRDYNEKIVNFSLSLARQDSEWAFEFTPFDIMKGIMLTEGHSATASDNHQITLNAFAVTPSFVGDLRASVVDATVALLRHRLIHVAVKAAKFLRTALQSPIGLLNMKISRELSDEWSAEFVKTIEKVKASLNVAPVPTVVAIEIARSVAWHAKHSRGPVQQAASELLKMMPDTLEYRTLMSLVAGSEQLLLEESGTENHQNRWQAHLDKVRSEIFETYSAPGSSIRYLCQMLHTVQEAQLNKDNSTAVLANHLILGSLELAEEIIRSRLSGEHAETQPHVSVALSFILSRTPDKGRDFVEKLLLSHDRTDWCAVGRAYGYVNVEVFEFTEWDIGTLRRLLSSPEDWVVHSTIMAIRSVAMKNVSDAVSLFHSLKPGASAAACNELLGLISSHGPIKFEDFGKFDVNHILGILAGIPELDGYWVGEFLAQTSLAFSLETCKFFMSRVDHATANEDWSFRPCNHGPYVQKPLRFRESPIYVELMIKVIDWMKDKSEGDSIFRYHSVNFFDGAFGPFDKSLVAFLDGWLEKAKSADLLLIGSLLSHAPRMFIFDHREFIESLLEQCRSVDEDTVRSVTSNLFSSAVSGVKHGTPGQPFPEDIAMLKAATNVLETLSSFSPAYALYTDVRSHAEHNTKRAIDDNE